VGKGPLQRSVAAVFSDQPVLIARKIGEIDAMGRGSYERTVRRT
jgi:hypothetical protein